MVGILVIVVGLLSIFVGGMMTRRAVKRAFGAVTETTMMAAQGTGVNPKSSPLLVIGGWLAVVVGIVLLFVL